MITKKKTNICILGSGFGGVSVLSNLKNYFRTDHDNIHIQLISNSANFLFTPLLHEVATGEVSAENIHYPVENLRESFFNFTFTKAKIQQLDPDNSMVITDQGKFSYDYLVISLGSASNFYGKEDIKKYALTLKTLDDAIKIKRQVLDVLERADKETDYEKKKELCTFIVAGGGATGVELTGGLSDFILEKLENYKNIKKEDIKIYIVELIDRLLMELSDKNSSRKARERLEQMGVSVLLCHKVIEYNGSEAKVLNRVLGETFNIKSSTFIWTAGIKPNQAVENLKLKKDEKGRIITDSYLSLPGYPNVYAIGDNACVEGEDFFTTAQTAVQQGKVVAYNIYSRTRLFRFSRPYKYFHQGTLITIGRKYGINDLFGLKVNGTPGWLVWKVIHLSKMMGTSGKINVFFDWLNNFLQNRYVSRK